MQKWSKKKMKRRNEEAIRFLFVSKACVVGLRGDETGFLATFKNFRTSEMMNPHEIRPDFMGGVSLGGIPALPAADTPAKRSPCFGIRGRDQRYSQQREIQGQRPFRITSIPSSPCPDLIDFIKKKTVARLKGGQQVFPKDDLAATDKHDQKIV